MALFPSYNLVKKFTRPCFLVTIYQKKTRDSSTNLRSQVQGLGYKMGKCYALILRRQSLVF